MSQGFNKELREQQMADEQEQYSNLQPQKNYNEQCEYKCQNQLEKIIMESIVANHEEKQDRISEEVLDKLDKLNKTIVIIPQQYLQIKMHELAISKILVLTHHKSQFRLVLAHHHLGQAYLNFQCYEQAIEHIKIAMQKSLKLYHMKYVKLYSCYILTTLSKCYFQFNSYEESLQLLKKAQQIQQSQIEEQSTLYNIEVIKMKGLCHNKLKENNNALQQINKAIELLTARRGENCQQVGKLRIQKAKFYAQMKNYEEAISEIKNGIKLLQKLNHKKIQIANYYKILSSYYAKENLIQQQVDCMRQNYKIYCQVYDQTNEKTLKVQKNMAEFMINNGNEKEGFEHIKSILEIEQKQFGQFSIEVGKTCKVIGNFHCSKQGSGIIQAQKYLKRAQKILNKHNQYKQVKNIRNKLNSIKDISHSKNIHEQPNQ